MNANGDTNNINMANRNDDEDRKLFLGGLSWDTTENDVRAYFSTFGPVADVSIKYDAMTGNPRGFGFITFASNETVDAVLKEGPHQLKGKVIDPKRAKSRPICKKIFVGGLDSNIPEDEIRSYFSKFGSVEGIELPYDRQKNRRREFCFVIFETEEAADAACGQSKQFVGNKECDIKKAQPQPVAQQQKRMQQGQYSQGENTGYQPRGGGRGGRGGRNSASGGSHPGAGQQGNSDWYGNNYYGGGSGGGGGAGGNYYGNYSSYGQGNAAYAQDYYNQYGYPYDYSYYYGYDGAGASAGGPAGPANSDYSHPQGNGSSVDGVSGYQGGHHVPTGGKIVRGKPNSNYHPYGRGSH